MGWGHMGTESVRPNAWLAMEVIRACTGQGRGAVSRAGLLVLVMVCVYVGQRAVRSGVHYGQALFPLCDLTGDESSTASLRCPLHQDTIQREGPIIVTFATVGWHALVENWLCSVSKVKLTGTILVVALDLELCPRIRNSPLARGATCFEPFRDSMYADTHSRLWSGSWGTPSYQLIIKFRTQVTLSLLLCQRQVLLADVDVTFLRDPLAHLKELQKGPQRQAQIPEGEFDMIFQRESMDVHWVNYFENWSYWGKWYACAGWYEFDLNYRRYLNVTQHHQMRHKSHTKAQSKWQIKEE